MLFDLEAPTFSPLFIEEIDVGLVDIDWTTRIINLDDNSGLPVTLEELEDYVMYLSKELGVGELMLQSVDKEGTWEGYDTDMISKLFNILNLN